MSSSNGSHWHVFFSLPTYLYKWHLVRYHLTSSDVTNSPILRVLDKEPHWCALSWTCTTRDYIQDYVASGCGRKEWMLAYMCLRPYLFLNHLEGPDKEHLGIPYYECPGSHLIGFHSAVSVLWCVQCMEGFVIVSSCFYLNSMSNDITHNFYCS